MASTRALQHDEADAQLKLHHSRASPRTRAAERGTQLSWPRSLCAVDENDEGTQWTDDAKADYLRRADELRDALAAHVATVSERTGRDSELEPYFTSADALKRAAAAFDDAEWDFCGSFPLEIELDEDEPDDDGDEDEEDLWKPATVLSALGRWDFNVYDPDALVAAGREARQEVHPDETPQERDEAVDGLQRAAYEIAHAHGWDALIDAPGLANFVDEMRFIPHTDYQGMGSNAFSIALDED
jgi:hypothetical protein